MRLWTAGEYVTAQKGVEWLLSKQMSNGGWTVSPQEYSETESEAMQAMAAAMPSPPLAVGGEWVPVNAVQLPAPWIGLASTTAIRVSFVCFKRIKKLQG